MTETFTTEQKLAMNNACLRDSLDLVHRITREDPEAEQQLQAIATDDSTAPGTRALLKSLMAMGQFAAQADLFRLELMAEQANAATRNGWLN